MARRKTKQPARRHKVPTELVGIVTIRELRPPNEKGERGYWQADFMRDGKRVREGFKTHADALRWANTKSAEIRAHGTGALLLTDRQRFDAADALKIIGDRTTLADAARFWARMNPDAGAERFAFTCWRYLRRLRREGARMVTIKNARFMLRHAARDLGDRATAGMTAADVQAWIEGKGYAGNSAKGYRRIITAALNFHAGKRAVREHRDAPPPPIFSPAEVKRIMTAAEKNEPALAPALALLFFAGLRPYEMLRLRWEDIHLDTGEIVVPAAATKTRQARAVSILPPLDKWLTVYTWPAGGLIAPGVYAYRRKRENVMERAAVKTWPVDAPRHSFASYMFARDGDAGKVAGLLGHFGSPALFARHYKAAARPADAREYFGIIPTKTAEEARLMERAG